MQEDLRADAHDPITAGPEIPHPGQQVVWGLPLLVGGLAVYYFAGVSAGDGGWGVLGGIAALIGALLVLVGIYQNMAQTNAIYRHLRASATASAAAPPPATATTRGAGDPGQAPR